MVVRGRRERKRQIAWIMVASWEVSFELSLVVTVER